MNLNLIAQNIKRRLDDVTSHTLYLRITRFFFGAGSVLAVIYMLGRAYNVAEANYEARNMVLILCIGAIILSVIRERDKPIISNSTASFSGLLALGILLLDESLLLTGSSQNVLMNLATELIGSAFILYAGTKIFRDDDKTENKILEELQVVKAELKALREQRNQKDEAQIATPHLVDRVSDEFVTTNPRVDAGSSRPPQ